jgi:hypothetical protein
MAGPGLVHEVYLKRPNVGVLSAKRPQILKSATRNAALRIVSPVNGEIGPLARPRIKIKKLAQGKSRASQLVVAKNARPRKSS